MKICRLITLFCGLIFLASCKEDLSYRERVSDPSYLSDALSQLTDIIVYDIFSPPVASRIYAYSSISGYQTICLGNPEYPSLSGLIKHLPELPVPASEHVNTDIAGVFAFALMGKQLIFSEAKMETFLDDLEKRYLEAGAPKKVIKASIDYAKEVQVKMMDWVSKDNYAQTRTFPKFEIRDEPGRWQPTPPDYMEGIEPHWREIRPLLLDSAQQFTPPLPTMFDMSENSNFRKDVMHVYETSQTLDDEKQEIASFWDCNPYVSHHKGHVMFATKKITPGGHWMGIARIAAEKDSADIRKTAKTYAYTAIALFDGFISCWDEKYRSNLLRPQTVINRYIDEDWNPLLQTPPFPEYTSGHSVISSAAAITLTSIYGDKFSFVDTVELPFGLPARSFGSFLEASSEAAISRLYGGIHYLPAIENGVKQGKNLGMYIVSRLNRES